MKNLNRLGVVLLVVFSFFLGKSCAKPIIVEKIVEVIKEVEVPVEKIVEVEKKIYIKQEMNCPDVQEKLVQQDEIIKIETKNEVKLKKNRIFISGGLGPDDYKVEDLGGGNYKVNQSYDEFTYGLGYQRSINEKYNIGIQGISNKTLLINLGFDY